VTNNPLTWTVICALCAWGCTSGVGPRDVGPTDPTTDPATDPSTDPATDPTDPYLATTDTTLLSDGVHNFQARAANGAGGVALTPITSYVVDNSPPLVSLDAPTATTIAGTAVTVTGSATDPHTAITLLEILIDGGVVAATSGSPLTIVTNTTIMPDGNYLFEVRATNAAGWTTSTT